MAEILAVSAAEQTAAAARGADVLRGGGLVVAPVGGMYGVLADVTAQVATERIFRARGADPAVPLSVVIHNPRALPTIAAEVIGEAERLMATYWPGPLTLIVRVQESLEWHLGESGGSVALRMPAEPLALMLISKTGPLACAAAARAGSPPPTAITAAQADLGEAVDLYLDEGDRDGGVSTVVDVSRGRVEVLRVGAIPEHHVAQVASGAVPPGQRPVDPPDDTEEDAAPVSDGLNSPG